MLKNRQAYHDLLDKLNKEPEDYRRAIIKELLKEDLYFLCWFGLGWSFYDCDFGFNFCKMIEEDPWKLFLVARGHLKSLTLTTAHNIQLVLNDPEETIAIISYNLKTAKSFLRQIKQELETNELLMDLFPEIFYKKPEKESPKWSEQEGLIVKRSVNRKEPTFFAFGLVDSQATGMHFDVHSFDDVITQDSVTSAEMIEKTTERWQLSDNLGMSGAKTTRKKYAGTRYHYFDTYGVMIKMGMPHIIIPAIDENDKPIFLSQEELDRKKAEQGSYIFSCQLLLRPVAKEDQKFHRDMVKYYDEQPTHAYKYLAIDPANEKNKKSDYTAGLAFAFSPDRKVYLIDGIHDKLNLKERYDIIKSKHDRYQFRRIGYEKYGMQTDLDYFRMENEKENYYMPMFKMAGQASKEDRILRLVALFENGDILFPRELKYWSKYENKEISIIDRLIFEMESFPFGEHDDLLDCLSRILDLFFNDPTIPQAKPEPKPGSAGERFEQMLRKDRRR